MAKFRKNPPLQIAGINTIIVEDYSQRTILDLKSGKKEYFSSKVRCFNIHFRR